MVIREMYRLNDRDYVIETNENETIIFRVDDSVPPNYEVIYRLNHEGDEIGALVDHQFALNKLEKGAIK
ncbi:MAG: hypothetical protein Q6362_009230 [Candidatus Wukongarchaeota archaeon]|jgi:hypothetical protein|nr:hypothetical protein [Candidatus Wukongarchaeota archaeon]MDO8129594.1 hypothetical protein [Candidatus Wukongarchaeota archaeon]